MGSEGEDLAVDRSTKEEDAAIQISAQFSQMARTLLSAGTVTDVLQHVVDLAATTIDGCDCAGIFLLKDDKVTTPVTTDPLVSEIDSAQHRCQEGPCLEAILAEKSVYAGDLAGQSDYLNFAPQATAIGIRSILALHFSSNGNRGALNLYARCAWAFGVVDRAKGQLLASLADIALSAAEAHSKEERRLENLKAALASRELIGQAQGILIERERITAEEAFDVLRKASQHFNVKLITVAQDLVDSGERPKIGN